VSILVLAATLFPAFFLDFLVGFTSCLFLKLVKEEGGGLRSILPLIPSGEGESALFGASVAKISAYKTDFFLPCRVGGGVIGTYEKFTLEDCTISG
jgi:hypothetical protein